MGDTLNVTITKSTTHARITIDVPLNSDPDLDFRRADGAGGPIWHSAVHAAAGGHELTLDPGVQYKLQLAVGRPAPVTPTPVPPAFTTIKQALAAGKTVLIDALWYPRDETDNYLGREPGFFYLTFDQCTNYRDQPDSYFANGLPEWIVFHGYAPEMVYLDHAYPPDPLAFDAPNQTPEKYAANWKAVIARAQALYPDALICPYALTIRGYWMDEPGYRAWNDKWAAPLVDVLGWVSVQQYIVNPIAQADWDANAGNVQAWLKWYCTWNVEEGKRIAKGRPVFVFAKMQDNPGNWVPLPVWKAMCGHWKAAGVNGVIVWGAWAPAPENAKGVQWRRDAPIRNERFDVLREVFR